MHPRPSTPRARLLVVAAAYVVVALWFVWPLPLHGTTHVSYPAGGMAEIGADLRLITWALAWDTHALLTDPAHLFDANIFHPAPSAHSGEVRKSRTLLARIGLPVAREVGANSGM